jgi:multimeric flavodoxin WrbA
MKRILVVYHSQEKGNTQKMAELVAQGCSQVEGVEATVVNVNERRVTMDEAESADGYAIGSPDYFSYVAGNVKQFFDDILLASWQGRKTIEKPWVGFITHGGGGAAVQSLDKLATSCKLEQIAPTVACKGAPESQEDVAAAVDLGTRLARHLAG